MGRLTTATGLRLGKKVTWRNGGLILKNLNCVKLFLFVEQLPNFYAINKWVLGFNYLFGYARVIQKKKYVEVNYYAYEVNSLFAGKLLKGYKKVMRRLLLKNLYKKRLNDISRKNYKLKKQIIVIKKYEKKYPINFYNEKIKDKKNKKILRIGKRKNLWYYKLYYAKCYYWVTKKKMRQIITKYSKKKKLIEKLKKNLISFNQVKKKKKKIIEKTNYNLKIIKNIRPIIKKKKSLKKFKIYKKKNNLITNISIEKKKISFVRNKIELLKRKKDFLFKFNNIYQYKKKLYRNGRITVRLQKRKKRKLKSARKFSKLKKKKIKINVINTNKVYILFKKKKKKSLLLKNKRKKKKKTKTKKLILNKEKLVIYKNRKISKIFKELPVKTLTYIKFFRRHRYIRRIKRFKMRRYFAYWRNLNYKVKIRVFKRPQLKKDKRYQYFLNKRYLLRNKRNYLRLQAYRGIILERQQLFYKYNYYLNLKKEKKKIKDFVKRQLYLKVIKKLLKKELKRRKKLVKSKNYMYVYNLNKGIVKKKMIVPLYKKVIKRKIVNYSVNKKKLINLFKKEKNTSGKQYIKLLKKSRIGEANKLSIKHSLDTVVKNFIKKNKYTSTIQIDNSNELYNRLYYFKTFKAIFEKKKYKLALISVKKKYLLKKKKKISLSLYNKYKYWQKNTAQFSNRKLLKNKFNYYQNNYYQNKFYYKRKRRYKSKFKFKYKFKYKRLFKKFWKKRKKYYKKYVKKLVKMRIKLKNRFLMYKVQKKKAYLLTDKLFKNVKHIINYNKKINTLKNKLILGSTVNIIKFRMKMHNFSFNLVKKCDEELLDNFNKNYMSNFVKIFINKYQEIMLKKKKNNNYIINILKLKLIREQQSLLLNNNKIMDIKKKLSFKHLIKNKYIYLHNKGQYKAIKKTKDMKKKYVTHRIKQNFLTRLIKMKLKQQLVTYKLLSYKRYILKQKNKQRYNFISHSFIKQFNVLKRQRFVYRYKYSNGFLFKKVYRLQYIKRYNLIMKKKNYNKHSSTNITKVDYWRRHMTASIVSKYWLMRFLSLEKAILTYAQVLSLEVKCNFIIITNYHYTADVLVRYLSVKFEQKFTINQAVKPLVHFLKKLIRRYKILNGFRIILAGRFTRRQRASRREFRAGNVPLTTLNANIDYAHAYSVLKDGTCGIKIWLNKSNNIIGGDFRLNST